MIMDVATKIATKKTKKQPDITETGKNICTATSNLRVLCVDYLYLDMASSSITFHLWTRHESVLRGVSSSWEMHFMPELCLPHQGSVPDSRYEYGWAFSMHVWDRNIDCHSTRGQRVWSWQKAAPGFHLWQAWAFCGLTAVVSKIILADRAESWCDHISPTDRWSWSASFYL